VPPYDIWKVQDTVSVVDGPYNDEEQAKAVAKELTEQTGQRHIAVEHGSEQEKQLLCMNPNTR
jgi:G:T/U-mismatch repair DNA glycosylase